MEKKEKAIKILEELLEEVKVDRKGFSASVITNSDGSTTLFIKKGGWSEQEEKAEEDAVAKAIEQDYINIIDLAVRCVSLLENKGLLEELDNSLTKNESAGLTTILGIIEYGKKYPEEEKN